MMMTTVAAVRQFALDDRGGEEGAGKLLIFALVAIPLLILLIMFGKDVTGLAQNAWKNLTGNKITPSTGS
jgi:hypothetical protein